MFIKNSKEWLIIANLIFCIFSYSQPVENSDIRIEILSKIKVYQKKIENLEKMLKISDGKEKELIKKHIKLLKEKIKNLQRALRKYEENISNTS